MIKLIYPPLKAGKNEKIVFLAGPMIGSSNWRAEMISLFNKHNHENKEFTIASPQKMLKSRIDLTSDLVGEEQTEQIIWETSYMTSAAEDGILIFWLGKELLKIDDRCYAQTTRFELGEWYSKSLHYPASILIGYDESFPGISYIKKRFSNNKDFYQHFFDNMEDLVKFALKVI